MSFADPNHVLQPLPKHGGLTEKGPPPLRATGWPIMKTPKNASPSKQTAGMPAGAFSQPLQQVPVAGTRAPVVTCNDEESVRMQEGVA